MRELSRFLDQASLQRKNLKRENFRRIRTSGQNKRFESKAHQINEGNAARYSDKKIEEDVVNRSGGNNAVPTNPLQ